VRVYRSDSEGITLQIRREREFMSAWLPVADALAAAHAICDPRAVPGFSLHIPPGMPSSTTPGNPIIDSSRATMSAWPSPRVDRLGTPKTVRQLPPVRIGKARSRSR
jgi:hypothetical protein